MPDVRDPHDPFGAPDTPPFEECRTLKGPADHQIARVAKDLAPTFGIEVDVVSDRRTWGGRHKVRLRARGDGPAVVRYWDALEDSFPSSAGFSLWQMIDWP